MQPTAEHACPRCYQALTLARPTVDGSHSRVLLSCPETYCEYVLALSERELAALARRWAWLDFGWLLRAAS
jgi:hypothetical protein